MTTISSPGSHDPDPRGAVIDFDDAASFAPYTTAVSLHAHTNRSREGMGVVPRYLEHIPIVAPLARREMRRYERRNGRPVDFGQGWWHPPVAPEDVLASERAQIAALGLKPLVSITDHDSIDACLALAAGEPQAETPISCEWTVPVGRGFLHVGVHNLPPADAEGTFRALAAFTRGAGIASLARLLDRLNARPDTLLVLNHPLWDLAAVGDAEHRALVRGFLAEHGNRIHALELNGYRSRRENNGVAALADACGLPLISGGDRHGCAPNSLLNLTSATTFGAFAREIREARRSTVLVMPTYREALVARKLAVAFDVLREYPSHPSGQRRWNDRISYERDGVVRPLSHHWPGGGPIWVRSAIGMFRLATSPSLRPALRLCVWLAGASQSDRIAPAESLETAVPRPAAAASYNEIGG